MFNFSPRFVFERIYNIDEKFIKENAIRAIILDVDNTLTAHGAQEVSPEVSGWIFRMRSMGVKLLILSNNSPDRVRPFSEKIGVDFLTGTKPKKSDYRHALEHLRTPAQNCAGVGDQIFTDVWGANESGLISILTLPLYKEETAFIKLKRILEKPIVRKALKGVRR